MSVRIFWRLIAGKLMRSLAYRADFAIYMFNTVVGPLIALMVWLAVSEHGAAVPYDRPRFVTYYVLLGVVSAITGTWIAPYVAEGIRKGRVSPLLLRPVPLIVYDIADNIGQKLVMLPLLLPQVALAGVLFSADLRIPTDPQRWLLFAASLLLAAIIAFLMDFSIGLLAFWIEDVWSIHLVAGSVGGFLSGQVVPLAFFPPRFAPLLEAQPFRYALGFPLEVLVGDLATPALVRGFAWQIGYAIAFYAGYRLLWRAGLRAYAAAGA